MENITYRVTLTDGIAYWVSYRGPRSTAEAAAASWKGATVQGRAIIATVEED